MTGGELKFYALIVLVVVFLPGLVLSIYRYFSTCRNDENAQGGYLVGFIFWLMSSLIAFVPILVSEWDDNLPVMYILGLAVSKAFFVSCHIALIIIATKFWDMFIPSKDNTICVGGYSFAMVFALIFLWAITKFGQQV